MEPQYENFTTEELAQDAFFYEWVTAPTQRHHAFWSMWLKNHPEKEETLLDARRAVLNLMTEADSAIKARMDADWRRVRSAIEMEERSAFPRKKILQYAVAASLAIFVLAVGQYYLSQEQNAAWNHVETAYGERHTLLLPDGSEVTLNGNSRLRYAVTGESAADVREVWLDGEAYFQVSKQKKNIGGQETPVRFIVHSNHMEVEVLGTTFTVRTRKEQTLVALSEGSVRVLDKNKNSMLLRPGELAEFNDQQKHLEKRRVNDHAFSSWRGDKIIFDNEPIGEIFQWLEETYGYHIEIDDPELLKRRYTGSVPVKNVELLFEKIATLYGLHLRKQDKNMSFERK